MDTMNAPFFHNIKPLQNQDIKKKKFTHEHPVLYHTTIQVLDIRPDKVAPDLEFQYEIAKA